MRKIFSGIFLILFVCTAVHAGGYTDSLKKRTAVSYPGTEHQERQVLTLTDLDKLINEESDYTQQPQGYTQQYFEDFNAHSDPGTDELRKKAASVFQEIETSNNYIDYLNPSNLNKLPFGLIKKAGNMEVVIGVSSVVFTSRYAALTVFARLTVPQWSKPLYFGVSGIKLSHDGGIIGDANIVLLGDFAIPFSGGNGTLILKGGINMETGQGLNRTYVTIDCNGFKELGLAADVKFPKSLLTPVDGNGSPLPGNVTGSFSTVVANWNDILVNIDLPNFEIVGLKGITFNISGAVFDFSDYRNSSNIVYPPGYQEKYMVPGNYNLWRGVYARDISVILPKAFKDRTANQRISFGAHDLLIDNNGLTGLLYAENVLPINKGTASGWKISVDSISIGLEANHLVRAGFNGMLGLPLVKANDNNTGNKKKFLAYSAYITAGSRYVCRVTTMDSLDFDVFNAVNVKLFPNSYIQLAGSPDGFKPEAMLHGSMGILSRSYGSTPRPEGSNPVADMKGIQFRSLHLKTEAPYLSVEYFGYTGEIKVANFPVSLSDIALQSLPNNEVALGFTLTLNLQENEFGGHTRLSIIGKLDENEGLQSWSYSRLRIEEVSIHADVKALTLDGSVKFMDDDPIYGDGFDGSIEAKFKAGLKLDVSVRAIFGKKQQFRYWFIDGRVSGLRIPIGPGISITGFAGGAYFRMKKEGIDNASPTNVRYVPDSTAGLGVRAGVLFNFGADAIANGEASFEVAFNRGGGMRYIGFFGYVKVLQDILPKGFGVEDYITKKFTKIADRANELAGDTQLDQLKIFQPSVAASKVLPTHDNEQPGQQGLSAYIGIQYNFNEHTLDASFDLYINAAGGLLKGAASGNRAGWAVLHIGPDKWFLHMGRPNDRLGIKFGIGSFNITTGSYFMVGHDIPAFPPPPPQVINILAQSGLAYEENINEGELGLGKGLAFGANISLSTGDLRFLMFYANFEAGVGFDVMIKDWGDAHCVGSTDPIGINGWYAEGQAYVYLQGELGIRIRIFGIKKKISIIKGGAAALLQAKLPNPTWVGGYLGFHISILGGLIEGNFRFKFSFGNQCDIVQDSAASDYDNFTVIAGALPDQQSTNIALTVRPQLSFSLKPGKIMEMENNQGVMERFYPSLEYFKVVESSNPASEVQGSKAYINNGMAMTLEPNEMLKPNTDYKIMAKVSFMEYKYNTWVVMTENGQAAQEVKEYTFRTGNGPDTIPYNNISRMYPFFNQRNLYKDEPRNGMITLYTGMTYLFNGYNTWKARIKTTTGQVVGTTDASYTAETKKVSYTLPATLNVATTYRVEIFGENTNGSNPMAKPIISFLVTTSQYSTLAQKIQALQMTQPVVGRISSDVIDLQAKVSNYEGFEKYELIGNAYTGNTALITGEAIIDDNYYHNKINPLVYPTIPLTDGTTEFYIQNRTTWELGAPPVKAIRISAYYLNALQGGMYNEYVKTRLPFVYDLVRYYNRDFNDLRTQVINHYLQTTYINPVYGGTALGDVQWQEGCSCYASPFNYLTPDGGYNPFNNTPIEVNGEVPLAFQLLVQSPFPFISSGDYKVKFKFSTPEGVAGSESNFNFRNPIQ
jgi:hypothetical protein